MNIFELIKEETRDLRDKAAVVEGDRAISYGSLLSAAESLAGMLREKGVSALDRVGLVCDNSIEYITLSLAVLSIPAVIVPVSPEHTKDEIDEILESIETESVIYREGTYMAEGAEKLVHEGLGGDGFFLSSRKPVSNPPDEYYSINPAFIRFSSGTTGKSKGVVLSHESIAERTEEADRGLKVVPGDTVLWVLSMSFHFVVTILLFLRRGATIVLCNNPFLESLAEGVEKHGGTFIYAAPVHYNLMCGSGLFSPGSLRNIRLAVSTTIKLPGNIAEEFHEKFGFQLAEAYGIIEVGLPFINFHGEGNGGASVGRALPGYEVRIDGPDGEGTGEICIRGRGMLDAYFSPWRSREDVLDGGWFRTGDLGRLDGEGFLTLVGRKKNVINFTGMKIFPSEVEEIINQYPGVKESLVYGEDHPRYGQLPMAKVVAADPGGGTLDLEGLRRFCYRRLAQYKVPKGFDLVAELPRTMSGKIKRGR